MKKRNLLTIGLVLLALIAAYLIYQDSQKSDKVAEHPLLKDRDFAYKAIDEIQYISLKRPRYPLMVFKKKGSRWYINDRYEANAQTVNHMLAVLQSMRMKYIPPVSMSKTIDEDIKKNGIEIKLFKDSSTIVRHYFVGTEFGGGADTPVKMQGATQAFMMELGGLDGSIRRRLNFDLGEWRTKELIRENPDLIQKIKVEYPRDLKNGFTLLRFNSDLKVLDADNKEIPSKTPNQNTISAYFDFYTSMVGESNETENPEKTNILKGIPFCVINVTTKDGLSKEYKFYSLGDLMTGVQTLSPNDMSVENKYFGLSNDNFILFQHRIVGKLFKPVWYFFQ